MQIAARVELCPPTAADEPEFVAAMRASRELHLPWLTTLARTSGEYAAYLDRNAGDRFAGRLVRRRSDGALVGVFNISEIIRGGLCSAFLGYGAVGAHAGQGYMREGLALVLAEAFGPLRLHRLEASIQPANHASIALVRGGGFRYEGLSPRYLAIGGRWRDHERWAADADTWRALSAPLRVRERGERDLAAVAAFLDRWGARHVARRGAVVDALRQPALVAERDDAIVGLLTYAVDDRDCELLTLHAGEHRRGVGSALLARLHDVAARAGCARLWVVATNDALDALRFYQRRGFVLADLRAGAADRARRQLKPDIPPAGGHGIAIRDELELECRVRPARP